MEMTRDLYSLNYFEKLMVLLCQILLNPASAATAEVILMQIFAMSPSMESALKYVELITSSKLLAFHASICTDVTCAAGHDLALFCANFHSIGLCFVYRSVGKILDVCHCCRLQGHCN